VTRESGYYESGAFDVRGHEPRATALTAMIHALAHDEPFVHPVLETPGWWHRKTRPGSKGAPILIVSDIERPDRSLAAACETRGLTYVMLDRRDIDVAVASSVAQLLDAREPWAVIDTTGYTPTLPEECEQRAISFALHAPDVHDAHVTLDILLDDDCTIAVAAAVASIAPA
jgi:dTDP-4-dehydrorhamnose reductase